MIVANPRARRLNYDPQTGRVRFASDRLNQAQQEQDIFANASQQIKDTVSNAMGFLGPAAKRVPWGKVGIVGAAALPVLSAMGDPNADPGKVALESGAGALGAWGGGAIGAVLGGGPVGALIGSTVGGMVLPAIAGGAADLLKGGSGSGNQEFADPRLSDALRYGRELAKLEADKASMMAPILASIEREQAKTANFIANNEWNNRFTGMALEGAMNTASSTSPALLASIPGMFV
ncbi:hypothetical protein [Synechococcus elongatus]|uniref:hypothetical protein n=1 Tax=Synechococcus elongatus TaxID=32046 RepID=UPI000F7EB9AE|nr:hypothetical protein [Synechococcus elongatus]